MNSDSAIDLMFEGMRKLGPGDDGCTLEVLRSLPTQEFQVIVDAGCGTGRQTLLLARELSHVIQAVDSHESFLAELSSRAEEMGIGHLVQTHCMDMKDIPSAFPCIDLLWSEGAAYNIGFENALRTWSAALSKGAWAVVSELSWLREDVPSDVAAFFKEVYPDMQLIAKNIDTAESAGFRVTDIFTLPESAWTEDYYDVLKRRAMKLVDHSNPEVSQFARETLQEIEIFDASDGSYGYTFYVLCWS